MGMLDYKNTCRQKKIVCLDEHLKALADWKEQEISVINSDDVEEFKALYNLYEFSDNVSVLMRGIFNYPTLFNYVDTGVLSVEEMIKSILRS